LVDAKPTRPVHADVQRLSSRKGLGTPDDAARIWSGDLDSEVVIPGVKGGYYRAEARIGGRIVVGDARVDDSEGAPDLQELVLSGSEKIVDGTVTRANQPVVAAHLEAVPDDAVVTSATTRLATAITDTSGAYRLSFSYPGRVSVLAATGTWSKSRSVDLKDEERATADFDFRVGRASVHVIDRVSGEPIVDATLASEFAPRGMPSEGLRTATADAKGEVHLEDLEEGVLTLRGFADGYSSRVMRDVAVPADADLSIRLELTRKTAYRIRTSDPAGTRIPSAEILVCNDLGSSRPRTDRTRVLGRTNDQGELILSELLGEPAAAFVVAAGYTARIVRLPAAADAESDLERNTADVVLTPYAPGPGLRVRNQSGETRDEALVLFSQQGVEIPLAVIARSALLNGVDPTNLVYGHGDRATHYQELLAPGIYDVMILSPGVDGGADSARDTRDRIGVVTLPLTRAIELVWREDREIN
jgi:hypothetical protein